MLFHHKLYLMICCAVAMTACHLPMTAVPAAAADGPWFTNVSEAVGLTSNVGFRVAVVDINGDDYADIILHEPADETAGDVAAKQVVLLNMPGDDPNDPYSRKFVDFTQESGIRTHRDGTLDARHSSSCIFADVDNDGDVDMFSVVYIHRNYTLAVSTNDLHLNDGQGHFTASPNATFHTEPIYNTACAVFLDYNNDSSLDLFIGNWYYNEVLSQDHLYMGHGDGSFTRTTDEAGMTGVKTAVYGIAAGDYNGDGYMDIFEPSYSWTVAIATPILWKNNHDGTFSMVQEQSNYNEYGGSAYDKSSFGSMPFDYDNDGDLDFFEIYTHGRADGPDRIHSTLVTNNDNVFSWDFGLLHGRMDEDPLEHHGDHFASFIDVDNDSLYDIVLTENGYNNNRIYMFVHHPDHTFTPDTPGSGLDPINTANLASANVNPVDFDRDGDEDLVIGFGGTDPIQLWRNDVGTDNNWLSVKLEGAGIPGYSNRSAIGARISVTFGDTTLMREVSAGNGHQCPQVPLWQAFGLGESTMVNRITVRWPNQTLSESGMLNVPANQFIKIREPHFASPPAVGVRLEMPSDYFVPGDTCGLKAFLFNDGESIENAPLFILLGIAGQYWFWDGWSQDLDYNTVTVPTGVWEQTILPEFPWPDTGGSSFSGIEFLGAMLNETMSDILGGTDGLDIVTFGYGD